MVNVRFCTALALVAPLLMIRATEVLDHEVACSNRNGTHGGGDAVRVQQQFKSHWTNIACHTDITRNKCGRSDGDGSIDGGRVVSAECDGANV
jgi:hypothetical protein